jgi:ERCC4-type nuclease
MEDRTELTIDTREHALIKLLEDMSVEFTVDQLDVGDALVRKGEETIAIFERKSLSDLRSSICDGRHREQKARLVGTHDRSKIVYLIEGEFTRRYSVKVDGMPLSTMIGSMINTQHRDGIKVYRTGSTSETAEYLALFLKKCEKGECVPVQDADGTAAYAATLQKQKKANVTPELLGIRALSCVPRVTEVMAAAIMRETGSLRALFRLYDDIEPESARTMLSDVTYVSSSGKERRVGPAASAAVYSLLTGV